MGNWQRLSGKIVYKNPYIEVYEDEVVTPDGRSSQYGWVSTPPAVFIVAINDAGEICLVQQERYVTKGLSWEVPAGNTDGQDPLAAAQRELAEEAGLTADHWQRLPAEFHPYNSIAAERDIIFIANGLHKLSEPITGTDEVITAMAWKTWPELKQMMKTGTITDGQTVTVLALAALHLDEWK